MEPTKRPKNRLLHAAIKYARRGWPVFPCHTIDADRKCTCGKAGCKSPGKHPRTTHGLKDATTDPKAIREWWRRWPRANIAIATGKASGLAVLDADKQKGGVVALGTLRRKDPSGLNTPLTSRTGGGGRHLFFQWREGLKNSAGKLAEGIDVRAEGGYIIAPPSKHISGRPYRWLRDRLGGDGASKLPPFPAMPNRSKRPRGRPGSEGGTIPEGERNDALIREGGRLRAVGMDEAGILEGLRSMNRKRCIPPLADDEVAKIAESAARYPAGASTPGKRPRTDAGNAELMADLYGKELRYDHSQGRWLIWRGHCWAGDCDGELPRRAILAARQRQGDAADVPGKEGSAEFSWGKQSESRSRIEAAIVLARNIPPFSDRGEGWDAKPHLLACQNGVVDLRTGKLRDGRPEDKLCLGAPHGYVPGAPCKRWLRFLREILPDHEVRIFVCRAIGYSMTGEMGDQCFFLLSGTGANGKTTLLETLRCILGPLARNLPFSSFTAKWGGREQTNDIAQLPGTRLVMASETGESARLDEARVKALTGGDTISARLLYREHFQFRPVCKLWLCCNHRPIVVDDTHAFWRRVRCIDFPVRFADERADSNLPRALAAEAEGILAWCVRQAVAYLAEGKLVTPEGVRLKTDEYQSQSDPLSDFINERCEAGPEHRATFAGLYDAYLDWAQEQHLQKREILARNKFGTRLQSQFSKAPRRHGKRLVSAIRLRDLAR